MAKMVYFCACIIAVLFLQTVSGVSITTTPNTINIDGNSPTTSLRISCSPNTPGITALLSLELGKKNQFGGNQPIVSLVTGQQVEIQDSSYEQRMTQSGSISGTSGNLEITLTDLSCSDAASYYCSSTYLPSGSDDAVSNVSSRTYPRNIEMNVFPNRIQYSVGEQVEFNCNGNVGNVFSDAQSLWVWEWRYIGTQVTGWTTYPYSQNITYEGPTTAANCQYSSRSILRHYLGTTDDERQFRCYVGSQDVGGNKTVNFQASSTDGTPGAAGSGPENANIGLIVGVVLGVLVAIVIVVVLVYFLVFRKRNGGDDYDTGEAKPTNHTPDSVVYSTPASRDSKQNRGKGRENDGLDEPHEKNPRPYLPKDYADHGRSNPAMDDNSSHNRSYDEDNTDSKMRSAYGSAV